MHTKRKPKLGQNFLVDDAARHAIVDALGNLNNRTVIEIGPGKGAITEILAGRCHRLIALELDRSLAPELAFRFRNQPNVQIIEADILKTDLQSLVPPGETADVIGNLPYYITSEILLQLFSAGSRGILSRAVLMMQREVADRVSAAPGIRDYGLLSATAQMNAQVDHLFTLPPSAFSPPPEVYSTVLRLDFAPRFHELGVDPIGFDSLPPPMLRPEAQDPAKQPARRRPHRRSTRRSLAQHDPPAGPSRIPHPRTDGRPLPRSGTRPHRLSKTALP